MRRNDFCSDSPRQEVLDGEGLCRVLAGKGGLVALSLRAKPRVDFMCKNDFIEVFTKMKMEGHLGGLMS